MQRSKLDSATTLFSFDSFQDFLSSALMPNRCKDGEPKSSRTEAGRYGSEFYGTGPGTQTWEDAVDVARKGWEDGRRKVEKMTASFAAILARINQPEITYNVCGDVIDMGRFMTGEPECFMTFTESEAETLGPKIVRVVLNGSVSSGVSPAVLIMRGCAIAAVIQGIELSGRRCEVTVAFGVGNYGDNGNCELRVLVKESGQPLQLDQLAFALAHPSMLRRLMFSFMETLDDNDRRRFGVSGGGYGSPREVTDKGDIYLEEAHNRDPHWKSEAAAKSWVIQLLGTQNVSLTPDSAD